MFSIRYLGQCTPGDMHSSSLFSSKSRPSWGHPTDQRLRELGTYPSEWCGSDLGNLYTSVGSRLSFSQIVLGLHRENSRVRWCLFWYSLQWTLGGSVTPSGTRNRWVREGELCHLWVELLGWMSGAQVTIWTLTYKRRLWIVGTSERYQSGWVFLWLGVLYVLLGIKTVPR